jgi:Chromo (CHRromatin Organisation MOdifier) domain
MSPTLPIISLDGQLKLFPEYILARRAIKRNNEAIPQLLVKWTNLSEEDASWEDYTTLKASYPDALLEDKQVFEDGGVSDEELLRLSPIVIIEEGDNISQRNGQHIWKDRRNRKLGQSEIIAKRSII